MASFDQISGNFKTYTQQKLDNLENELQYITTTESDIDDLEESLKQKVGETKQDINERIDEVQNTIISRRPREGDPDYARKRAQYNQLLTHSISGMDKLKGWLQNIFNRLIQIVSSIISWIANKISGIARRIGDAFKSLFSFFF